MRLLLFLCIALFTSCKTTAQNGPYDKAIAAFKTHFNAADYTAIFASFAPGMQDFLPLPKTTVFLSGLKAQMGKFRSAELLEVKASRGSRYKATFENGVLSLSIALDTAEKITSLGFQPFKEAPPLAGKAVDALQRIPATYATAVFDVAKMLPAGSQLSIALVRDGETTFYGTLRNGDSITVTDNKEAVFEIGSITKVFTGTLLSDAVGKGKIALTDDINRYFSFPFKGNAKIRFVDLSNHTAGMEALPSNLDVEKTDPNDPYKNYNKALLEAYLKTDLKIAETKGTKSEYSNLGVGLLGYTLGLAAKTDYKQLLQKTIFDDLKMTRSYTSVAAVKPPFVRGLGTAGQAMHNWDFDVLFGAGGILSTATDMAKFAQAQFNPANKAMALARVPTFTIDKNQKVGLGWQIVRAKSGREIYWHNGATGGYSSSMALDPERKAAVVILSNVTLDLTEGILDPLCFELLQKLQSE